MGLRHDFLSSKGLGQLRYFSSSALCSPSHRPRSAPVHSGCWPRSLRGLGISDLLGSGLKWRLHLHQWPLVACLQDRQLHNAKPQLLSMISWCLQNQCLLSDPYTLPSSAVSIDAAVAPSGPWLLCTDPEEIFPDFTSLMLVSS